MHKLSIIAVLLIGMVVCEASASVPAGDDTEKNEKSSERSGEIFVDLSGQVGIPKGEFSNELERWGAIGGKLYFGYRFGKLPFVAGAEIGGNSFGQDRRTEQFSKTIPDVSVRVITKYRHFQGNLVGRLIIPFEDIMLRPYVEGVIGVSRFYTETEIRNRSSSGSGDGEPIYSDENMRDQVFSYGYGGGVLIRLASGDKSLTNVTPKRKSGAMLQPSHQNYVFAMANDTTENEMNENPLYAPPEVRMNGETTDYDDAETSGKSDFRNIYLNFSLRFMHGDEAQYLQPGSISIENEQVEYDPSRSRTDLLYFIAGLVYTF